MHAKDKRLDKFRNSESLILKEMKCSKTDIGNFTRVLQIYSVKSIIIFFHSSLIILVKGIENHEHNV